MPVTVIIVSHLRGAVHCTFLFDSLPFQPYHPLPLLLRIRHGHAARGGYPVESVHRSYAEVDHDARRDDRRTRSCSFERWQRWARARLAAALCPPHKLSEVGQLVLSDTAPSPLAGEGISGSSTYAIG